VGVLILCAALTAPQELARFVPKDSALVVRVADTLPILDKVLQSKRLKKAFDGLGRGRGGEISLAEIKENLDAFRPNVPNEIVFACDDAAAELMAAFFFHTAVATLLDVNPADEAMTKETEEVETAWEAVCKRLKAPHFSLFVRFRDPQVANRLATMLVQFAPLFAPALKLHRDGKAWSAAFAIKDFGVDVSDVIATPTEACEQAIEKLVATPLHLRIDATEGGLYATLGPTSKPTGWAPSIPMGKRPAETLYFAEWNSPGFGRTIHALNDFVDKHRNGSLAKEAAKDDETPDVSDFARLFSDELLGVGAETRGAASMVLDGGTLRLLREYKAPPARPSLASLGLAAFIPPDADLYFAMYDPPHRFFFDWLAYIENKMALQSMRSEAKAEIEAAYYRRFGEFRALLRDGPEGGFEPGAVVLIDRALIPELHVVVHFEGRHKIDGRNVEIPALAFVGRTRKPEEVRRWAGRVAAAFANGVYDAGDDRAKELRFEQSDLGFGAPTYAAAGLWRALLPQSVDVKGILVDVVPHLVVADGFVVFSTSKALTKRVLERRGRPLPSDCIGAVHVTGDAYAETLERIFLGGLVDGRLKVSSREFGDREIDALKRFRGFFDLMRAARFYEHRSTLKDGVLRMEDVIEFRD